MFSVFLFDATNLAAAELKKRFKIEKKEMVDGLFKAKDGITNVGVFFLSEKTKVTNLFFTATKQQLKKTFLFLETKSSCFQRI